MKGGTNHWMTRILLIEEDAAMRALIHEWLNAAGYEVQAQAPQLVIASVAHLRGPGAMHLQQLRNSFPMLPLLVLSGQLGHSLPHDSETAQSLGVSALLAKPFARSELLAAIAKALGHGRP